MEARIALGRERAECHLPLLNIGHCGPDLHGAGGFERRGRVERWQSGLGEKLLERGHLLRMLTLQLRPA